MNANSPVPPAASPFSDALVHVAAPHAAWAVEQLETFNAFMPTGPWTADLDRRLYQQAGRDLRISVLGSYDATDGSWLWGWANPGFRGTPVVGAAESLREFGQAHGVPEFTEEVLGLGGCADPRMAVETLAFAAMGVLGAAGYIGVQASPDARLYMVPDDPQVPRAAPDPVTLPRMLLTGAGVHPGGPARSVVSGYFDRHRLPQRPGPGRISAELPGGAAVDVSFDDAGRIASVEVGTIGA
ncbi:DUF6882 domain-containing protein [Streptomyces chattanoogensis]|uniref:DUF6882 domain-containing protein n=1 Tax=Streptomyces chattanoogensis TaxID=66876 RepID=UPI000A834700|nr:DUF6882 domain-containing protein [Streptomyces chattanoogensis]